MESQGKKVLITNAAGHSGSSIVYDLLKGKGHGLFSQVKCVIGQDEDESNLRRLGADVIKVSNQPQSQELVKQLQGVDKAVIIPIETAEKVDYVKAFITACKQAEVRCVALVSMLGANEQGHRALGLFHEMETNLKESGIQRWIIVRTPFWMQNILLYSDQIKSQHALPVPVEQNKKFAPMDANDVGRFFSCLTDRAEQHVGKVFQLTGPEAVTAEYIAQAISQVIGTQVKYQKISLDEAKRILQNAREGTHKLDPMEIQTILDAYDLIQADKYGQVSNDFKEVVGEQPTSLQQWLKSNTDKLGGHRSQ